MASACKTGLYVLVLALTVGAICLLSPPSALADNNLAYECVLSGAGSGNLSGCISNPVGVAGTTTVAVTGNNDDTNITCSDTSFCGARAESGTQATAPIIAWNECRWIDNSDTKSIFVPFRTATEWTAFLTQVDAGKLPGVTETRCAVPQVAPLTIMPDSACIGPTPQSYTLQASLFARPGTHVVMPAYTFSCTVKGLCDSETPPSCGADILWTETATPTLVAATSYVTGSNAEQPYDSNYPWSVTVAYSGTAPAANPAPINGVCGQTSYNCASTWNVGGGGHGNAHGGCSSYAIQGSMCSSGTARITGTYCTSSVCANNSCTSYNCYASVPDAWTCTGSNGGASVSCRGDPTGLP